MFQNYTAEYSLAIKGYQKVVSFSDVEEEKDESDKLQDSMIINFK